jgi:outer membrane biosynthesis protein TonB
MDPTLVVIVFVILLAALLYYMYKDQRKVPAEEPGAKLDEPTGVKVRNYGTQTEAEKETEKPQPENKPEPELGPGPTPETEPEPESTESLGNLIGIDEEYRMLLRAAGVPRICSRSSRRSTRASR